MGLFVTRAEPRIRSSETGPSGDIPRPGRQGLCSSRSFQRKTDPGPQAIGRRADGVQRAHTVTLDPIVPLRPSTAHGRARTQLGRDQPLRLETIERGVDGAGGHLSPEAMLDLFQDRAAVTFLPENGLRAQQGKEHCLFEDAEVFSQFVCIVGK